jgi:hypothetical protein
VLVGDPQQLQSIEAGAAFRSVHERHGGAEIAEVRRQQDDWQRDATRDLATGRTGDALEAYRSRGMVHEAQTREQARGDLIDRWDRGRQASPDPSRIILTHTNAEVRALNEAARERMRASGDLGNEVHVTDERGDRGFASGDRVMFLQNERGLGVKNGTLGTVKHVSAQSMTVQTDDNRSLRFDFKDYNRIDHGYAVTFHKVQGMTVDRTHVLATPGMDAHSSYVALSRHRDGADLHYSRNDFANPDRLTRTLSRERAKDMASDYEQSDPARRYAERRGITFRERVAEIVRKIVPEKVRNIFDGLRPSADAVPDPADARRLEPEVPESKVVEDPEAALRRARTKALIRHARAVDALVGELSPAFAPALDHHGAVPVPHFLAKALFVHRAHGQHDMGMRSGHAVLGYVPMHIEIGDHAPIHQFGANEVSGQFDALRLTQLSRDGEFYLARQLGIFADFERLDIVPQPFAVAHSLRAFSGSITSEWTTPRLAEKSWLRSIRSSRSREPER